MAREAAPGGRRGRSLYDIWASSSREPSAYDDASDFAALFEEGASYDEFDAPSGGGAAAAGARSGAAVGTGSGAGAGALGGGDGEVESCSSSSYAPFDAIAATASIGAVMGAAAARAPASPISGGDAVPAASDDADSDGDDGDDSDDIDEEELAAALAMSMAPDAAPSLPPPALPAPDTATSAGQVVASPPAPPPNPLSRELSAFDADETKWNSSFQEAVEMPVTSRLDLNRRQEQMQSLIQRFVQQAKPIAHSIIRERMLPQDAPQRTVRAASSLGGFAGGEKYLENGILYKFARDDHGLYGCTAHAIKAAGNELRAMRAVVAANVPHLHLALSALFQARGHAVIATACLPVTSQTLVAGTSDGGVTVVDKSATCRQALFHLGLSLGLAPHRVQPHEGDPVTVAVTADVEGHAALDGRLYCLDLGRLMPPATPDRRLYGAHMFRQLRPELLARWPQPLSGDAYSGFGTLDGAAFNADVAAACSHLNDKLVPVVARKLDELCAKALVRKGEADEEPVKGTGDAGAGDSKAPAARGGDATAGHRDGPATDSGSGSGSAAGAVKPASSDTSDADGSGAAAHASAAVATATEDEAQASPVRLDMIAEIAHADGVNLRYLGAVFQLCKHPISRALVACDAVARAAKAELLQRLRSIEAVDDEPYATTSARLLWQLGTILATGRGSGMPPDADNDVAVLHSLLLQRLQLYFACYTPAAARVLLQAACDGCASGGSEAGLPLSVSAVVRRAADLAGVALSAVPVAEPAPAHVHAHGATDSGDRVGESRLVDGLKRVASGGGDARGSLVALELVGRTKTLALPPVLSMAAAAKRLREELRMREDALRARGHGAATSASGELLSRHLLPTLANLIRLYKVHRDEATKGGGDGVDDARTACIGYAERVVDISKHEWGDRSYQYCEALTSEASIRSLFGGHDVATERARTAVEFLTGLQNAATAAEVRAAREASDASEPAEAVLATGTDGGARDVATASGTSSGSASENGDGGKRADDADDGADTKHVDDITAKFMSGYSSDRGKPEALDKQLYSALSVLSQAQQEAGKYNDALSASTHALVLAQRLFGDEAEEVGGCMNGISSIQVYLGNTRAAVVAGRKAVAIYEKLFGPDNVRVADPLHTLAVVHKRAGLTEEAIRLLTRAVKIMTDNYGEDHHAMPVFLNNLAGCYLRDGQVDRALELYDKVSLLFVRTLGENHPDRAGLLQNIGAAYLGKGTPEALERAARSFDTALALMQRTLGEDHPKAQIVRLNIATVALEQGDYPEAIRIAADVGQKLAATFGTHSIHVAGAFALMGRACEMAGQHSKAAEAYDMGAMCRSNVMGTGDAEAQAMSRAAEEQRMMAMRGGIGGGGDGEAGGPPAVPPHVQFADQLAQLQAMGLAASETDASAALTALAQTGGNLEAALGMLLG